MLTLASRIGDLRIEYSVFSWPRKGIRRVYSAYFRSLLLGAALYIGAVTTVWISPGGAWIAMNTGMGRLWVIPPGAMIIAYFLYFSYRIHLLLQQCRDGSEGEAVGAT